MIKSIPVEIVKEGNLNAEKDVVAEEANVTIRCEKYILETYATPEMIKELAIGNIVSSGYLESPEQIKEIIIKKSNGSYLVEIQRRQNQAAKVLKDIGMALPAPEIVYRMNEQVRKNSAYFDSTGAFHYAFLFDKNGNIVLSAYDIGRFNAIDKVYGLAMEKKMEFRSCYLYTTGRIVGRMVDKAINLNVSLIVSKAPALYQAIDKAKNANITIIGFSRGRRYTIYSR